MPDSGFSEGSAMAKRKPTGFGSRLRQLREAAGLSQAQLAERAGLHLHGLTKLEQGAREPAWATVLAVAEALGVDVAEFAKPAAETPAEERRGRPPKPPALPVTPAAED